VSTKAAAAKRSAWRWLTIPMAFVSLLAAADLLYLLWLWPDWQALAVGPVPKSRIMEAYEARQAAEPTLPKLRFQAIPGAQIPQALKRAVVVAEDASFYQHHGIDFEAIGEALEYNRAKGRVVVGASTLSQQTVKNLFLNAERSYLRKWHELLLTWGMEEHLSKDRILTLYLNIAQFGEGIFGVEAAAKAYFGTHTETLTLDQCVALAAALPSPVKNNPATGTDWFRKRKNKIYAFMEEREWAPAAAGAEAEATEPVAAVAEPPAADVNTPSEAIQTAPETLASDPEEEPKTE